MATSKKRTTKRAVVTKACRKIVKPTGVNQTTGKLKKGFKYAKGGRVVAVKKK